MTQNETSLSNRDLARERTGLAIAGGGSVIVAILGSSWPDWVVAILAGIFIVVGFIIMISGLQRYHKLTKRLAIEGEVETIPTQLIVALTVMLQIATVIALILFLIN